MKMTKFDKFRVFDNFEMVDVEFESRISLGSVSEAVLDGGQILIRSGTWNSRFWITFVDGLVSKSDMVRFLRCRLIVDSN